MAKQVSQLPRFTTVTPAMLIPLVNTALGSAGSGYGTVGDCLSTANNATNAINAGASGTGQVNDGVVLQTIANTIALLGGVLFFSDGTYLIATNLNIPANVTVQFAPGAKFAINNGITVNLRGPLIAGATQITSGLGSLVLGAQSVNFVIPQWYGTKGDNITDDYATIQQAINSCAASGIYHFVFPTSTYKINTQLDFSALNPYLIPVVIDLNGSTLNAAGITTQTCAVKIKEQRVHMMNGKIQGPGNATPSTGGMWLTATQPAGVDNSAFTDIYVTGFTHNWILGTRPWLGAPTGNERVAFCTFTRCSPDACGNGFYLGGLVDKCSFNECNTAGAYLAGFHLAGAGSNIFNNPASYGDYPLLLIDGAIGEQTINHPQMEAPSAGAAWSGATTYVPGDRVLSGGVQYTCSATNINQLPSATSTYWTKIYFVLRTASGSGAGPSRPLAVNGGTINAATQLGVVGSGSAGSANGLILSGCTISAPVTVYFSDYSVTLIGCQADITGAPDINLLNQVTRATIINSSIRNMTANQPNAQATYINAWRLGGGVDSISGGALQSLVIDAFAGQTQSTPVVAGGIGGTGVNAAYSASITPNLAIANDHTIQPTNGTAFAVNYPTGGLSGQPFRLRIKNTFGVLGAITYDARYKFQGAAQPAAPANGFSTICTFLWDGSAYFETARSTGVPN